MVLCIKIQILKHMSMIITAETLRIALLKYKVIKAHLTKFKTLICQRGNRNSIQLSIYAIKGNKAMITILPIKRIIKYITILRMIKMKLTIRKIKIIILREQRAMH